MTPSRIIVCVTSWLALASLAGCGLFDSLLGKEPNPGFCPSGSCTPPDVNACASTNDCPQPSVCDVAGSKQCVQCTQDQASACTGTTPACGTDHMCRACRAHSDCPLSDACLPDGSCAGETDVAYVDPNGTDSATCPIAAPCLHIMKALDAGRSYVKLHGSFVEPVTIDNGRVVTVLADPGATLTRKDGGPVLSVKDDATSLAIYDLAIADAENINTIGVVVPMGSGAPSLSLTRVTISNIPGGGISVAGGSFTIAQSVVRNNAAGGVTVGGSTKFAIVGNLFINNGTGSLPTGAIAIATAAAATNRLEFNSFYKNAAQDGVGAAIQCVAGTFTAQNNIMFQNGTPTNLSQVGGNCAHAYSIIQPGTVPPGTGNRAADPLFQDPAKDDFHLQPLSPAIGAADPNSDLTGIAERDLDGTIRTRPATLGAYQFP